MVVLGLMGQNNHMYQWGGAPNCRDPPYHYVWGDNHAENFNQLVPPVNMGQAEVLRYSRPIQENNRVAMTTTQPKNSSEWQLYRVLQRANLLQYYDTFIAQGGDDVQQLCEAGEDEFLEIMALVGMASKPLHVRRLQKALQEWVANPAAFQGALSATNMSNLLSTVAAASSQAAALGGLTMTPKMDQAIVYTSQHSTPISTTVWAPSQITQAVTSTTPQGTQSTQHVTQQSSPVTATTPQQMMVPPVTCISPVQIISTPGSSSGCSSQGEFPGASGDKSSSSPVPTPVLVESQINSIAEAATTMATELPSFEAKRLNMKKQINREIMNVMQMPEEDPNRMEELRKYAAIYGRFDSKRKGEKPMSLHEISVNEAAAQLCRHRVTLLTRREDLFPLARQIVKNSGYQYSKGHSRASEMMIPPMSASKRLRFDPMFAKMCESNPKMSRNEIERLHREERMKNVNQELLLVTQRQEDLRAQVQTAKDSGSADVDLVNSLQTELEQTTARQLQLLTEQSDIVRRQRRAEKRKAGDNDDDDLASGSSSPGADNSGDGEEFSLLRSQFYASQVAKGVFMQDTLFDEGLRIAQQYGMADFAQELKQMNPVVGSNGNSREGLDDDEEGQDDAVSKSHSDNGASENGKESDSNKILPIKLASVNGTEFKVKKEPVETVNGS